MNYSSPVFAAPAEPTAADLADFEAYISHQLRGWAEPERADLEAYLRRFPGHSVGDWKGKGLTRPLEAQPHHTPWRKLKAEEVREAGTRTIARNLPRNIRQAAARDPGLIWNPLARKYRLRLPSDPPAEGGGLETLCAPTPRTGAGIDRKCKHQFSDPFSRARAPARVSAPARR